MPEGNKKLNDLLKLIQQTQAKHSLNPVNRTSMGTNTTSPGLNNTLNQFNTTAVSTTGISNSAYNTQNGNNGLSPYAQQVLATEQQDRLDNAIVNGTRNKYSENYLQSQGRTIPGLDSEGTSSLAALDIVYGGQLAKIIGQIGKQGAKKVLEDLTLKETVSGSPITLPKPSRIVQEENNLPFLQRDNDIIGELMNLGSEKGGRFFNRQKPISVSEWLESPQMTRNARSTINPLNQNAERITQLMNLNPNDPFGMSATEFNRLNQAYLRRSLKNDLKSMRKGMAGDEYYNVKANLAERNRYDPRELSDDYMNKRGSTLERDYYQSNTSGGIIEGDGYTITPNNVAGSTERAGITWNDGFRIVDAPTQNKLPYFQKAEDIINKKLAEKQATKDLEFKVEASGYGYKTLWRDKSWGKDAEWVQGGTMGLNASGGALTKGDMLLKPIQEAQQGVDAVFASSSFPFSHIPENTIIGKGYGKDLYRSINEGLKTTYGTRLNSGHNSLTEHSRALWNSLVDKGDAWRIGDPARTVQYGLYGGLLGTILAGQEKK